MSYTQEQIDRANQVDLEQFLRSHGEQVTKSGSEYRWKRHDSLTIKGNKWFRHSLCLGPLAAGEQPDNHITARPMDLCCGLQHSKGLPSA